MLGASIGAETIQYIFAIGATDIADVITNTLGGLIGLIAYDLSSRHVGQESLDKFIVVAGSMIRGAGVEHAPERPMLATTTVLELAGSIGPRLRCLVLLGGFGGLRTGELLGLRRRDIDPLHGTVAVVRQSNEITGQGRIFTAPKSDAGYRTMALPSLLLADIEQHLSDYVEVRSDAPLFTRPSGLPLRRADLPRALEGRLRRGGRDRRPSHNLRPTRRRSSPATPT